MVPNGATSIKEKSPIFKCYVLKQAQSKFALIVSLSHVVGDRHTFYKMHNMLGQDSVLSPVCKFSFVGIEPRQWEKKRPRSSPAES